MSKTGWEIFEMNKVYSVNFISAQGFIESGQYNGNIHYSKETKEGTYGLTFEITNDGLKLWGTGFMPAKSGL